MPTSPPRSLLCLLLSLCYLASAEVAVKPVLEIKNVSNWGAPCLIQEPDGFYSFATNNNIGNVPIAFSKDFVDWELYTNSSGDGVDAMPKRPAWVNKKNSGIWAPDVNKLDNGSYILYFAAVATKQSEHCIGVAFSDNVTGPYTSLDEPWYCPDNARDQAIDPDGFKDPQTGRRFITYKWNRRSEAGHVSPLGLTALNEEKDDLQRRAPSAGCPVQGPPWAPTPIVIQEVEQDGVTKIGQNYTLVDNNGRQDDGNTESPSLMRSPITGNYVLFFSTGCFKDGSYTVSYAVSNSSVTGPYERHSEPLFKTGEYNLKGPGTLDVLNDGLYTVFFSHQPKNLKPPSGRKMRTALIDVVGMEVMANGTLPGVNSQGGDSQSGDSGNAAPGLPAANVWSTIVTCLVFAFACTF